jgi:beta-lactamase regulating signal transducer with metallopeptidase domain
MITLLICSVTMSAVAFLYMAITPLLKKYFSEKGCYYAWLIIVIGLIIPFRPQFNNAIVQIDIPNGITTTAVQTGNEMNLAIPDNIIIPVDVIPSDNPALLLSTMSFSLWQIIAVVWLAGAIMYLAFYISKHCRFILLVKRWSENVTDERALSILQSLKKEMGISQKINLYQYSDLGCPMMFGFVKPRILLPKEELAEDELRFILKHELVHFKRKDLFYKVLVLIATAVHWFNPFVYLIAKAINAQCELSCDAEIILNTDAETRLQYSETIIGVIKYRSKLKTALSTNFYGGKKGMKNRISSIMHMTKKKAGAFVLCGALILTLGTGVVVAANANSPANQDGTVRLFGQNGAVQFFDLNQNTIGERVTIADGTEVLRINSSEKPDIFVFDEISGESGEVLVFTGAESSPRTFRVGGTDLSSFMKTQGQSPIIDANGEILMWVPQSFFTMTYEEFNEFAEQLTMLQAQETVDENFINILREHWLAAQ